MKNHSLEMLIFFVTGVCNAACHHCFYWQNLGPKNKGLKIEDIERISKSAPAFRTLLLSGGEPTLRSDLPQIINLFKSNNLIKNVSIPTNGILPERIERIATEITSLSPQLNVSFNLSIDGFAEIHDVIRGVEGNFNRSMESLERLARLAQKKPNFRVVVNTVICADNYHQVIPFARFIESKGLANGHFFEIARGDMPEKRLKSVPAATLREIYDQLIPIQSRYFAHEARRRKSGLGRLLREVVDVGNLINRYRHQLKVYAKGQKWNFPCMAGESIGVIDYNGKLRICELRSESVNLADYDYNFTLAWQSATIRKEASIAKTHVCDCTHTCFLGSSMRQSFYAQFLSTPSSYLLHNLEKSWSKHGSTAIYRDSNPQST